MKKVKQLVLVMIILAISFNLCQGEFEHQAGGASRAEVVTLFISLFDKKIKQLEQMIRQASDTNPIGFCQIADDVSEKYDDNPRVLDFIKNAKAKALEIDKRDTKPFIKLMQSMIGANKKFQSKLKLYYELNKESDDTTSEEFASIVEEAAKVDEQWSLFDTESERYHKNLAWYTETLLKFLNLINNRKDSSSMDFIVDL